MGLYENHVFPVLLDWATRPLQRDRSALLKEAQGCVLELGVGTGANLPFYTQQATAIHGIEPSAALLKRAHDQAEACADPQRFQLVTGDAQALPYPDSYFDTVVVCLVMCTIPDPQQAAREIFRVLKPGGQALLLEHVQSPGRWTQRLQQTLNPAWRHLACGCQLTRNTASTLRQAGFDMNHCQQGPHPRVPGFAGELLTGHALRP